MIQQSFIDMENMFDLLKENQEVSIDNSFLIFFFKLENHYSWERFNTAAKRLQLSWQTNDLSLHQQV